MKTRSKNNNVASVFLFGIIKLLKQQDTLILNIKYRTNWHGSTNKTLIVAIF